MFKRFVKRRYSTSDKLKYFSCSLGINRGHLIYLELSRLFFFKWPLGSLSN